MALGLNNLPTDGLAPPERRNHALINIKAHEVSLVTTPAAVSAEDAANGLGCAIVKLDDSPPAYVLKMFSVMDGEEVSAAKNALRDAARSHLLVQLANPEAAWAWMCSTRNEYVVLEIYDTDSSSYISYKMDYSRDGSGAFTFGDPVQVEHGFVPVAVQKDTGEVIMASKVLKIAYGDSVLETAVAHGGEIKIDAAVIKVTDTGDTIIPGGFELVEGVITKFGDKKKKKEDAEGMPAEVMKGAADESQQSMASDGGDLPAVDTSDSDAVSVAKMTAILKYATETGQVVTNISMGADGAFEAQLAIVEKVATVAKTEAAPEVSVEKVAGLSLEEKASKVGTPATPDAQSVPEVKVEKGAVAVPLWCGIFAGQR